MAVQSSPVFRFADIEVREQELRALRAGQTLEIEPKALCVMVYLTKDVGHLVSKMIDADSFLFTNLGSRFALLHDS